MHFAILTAGHECAGAAIIGASKVSDTDYFITGQVTGSTSVHTGGDIPLSAYGRRARLFGGTIGNTDVLFSVMEAVGCYYL